MSKTSDFAHAFASNLPIQGIEWSIEGKNLKLRINNDDIVADYEIRINVTKNHNKAEIWFEIPKHIKFVGVCSADNQQELCEKLTNMLVKEIEERIEKQTLKDVNRELCDYLTSEFDKNGWELINKVSNINTGCYVVRGPSGTQYSIVASYLDSEVQVRKIDNNEDAIHAIKTFNLSNPNVEKLICNSLLEYDQANVSKDVKNNLINVVKEMIISNIDIANYDCDGWSIDCHKGYVVCIDREGKFKTKFKISDVILEEA